MMYDGMIAGSIVFLFIVTVAFLVDPQTPFDFRKLAVALFLCLGWGAFIGWVWP